MAFMLCPNPTAVPTLQNRTVSLLISGHMHGIEIFFDFSLTVKAAPHGVSTQLQSSGLVAHENSTFRNLALAVSGPFLA